jgi:hypothetical protein
MRFGLWAAFFVVCNVLGVCAFTAAVKLPYEEAVWPRLLTVPLVGLTAFGITRCLDAWQRREDAD